MAKIIIIYIIFIAAACVCIAQQAPAGWQKTMIPETGVEFYTPTVPVKYDTLNTTLYAVAIDSMLAIQVHVFQNAQLNISEPVFSRALQQELNDTLRAIARLMLLVTNSELVELNEVDTSDVKGLELGIKYLTLAANEQFYTFIRYYFIDDKFISFTITGAESDIERLFTTKNLFFNTINIELL